MGGKGGAGGRTDEGRLEDFLEGLFDRHLAAFRRVRFLCHLDLGLRGRVHGGVLYVRHGALDLREAHITMMSLLHKTHRDR